MTEPLYLSDVSETAPPRQSEGTLSTDHEDTSAKLGQFLKEALPDARGNSRFIPF
jgi:hypothetical protein